MKSSICGYFMLLPTPLSPCFFPTFSSKNLTSSSHATRSHSAPAAPGPHRTSDPSARALLRAWEKWLQESLRALLPAGRRALARHWLCLAATVAVGVPIPIPSMEKRSATIILEISVIAVMTWPSTNWGLPGHGPASELDVPGFHHPGATKLSWARSPKIFHTELRTP